MPDASNLDAFVPIIVKYVDHGFGGDDVYFTGLTLNELAICGKVAGIDLGDLYVFFQDLHKKSDQDNQQWCY